MIYHCGTSVIVYSGGDPSSLPSPPSGPSVAHEATYNLTNWVQTDAKCAGSGGSGSAAQL